MSDTVSTRVKRLGAELAIVFIGVLIALAADSWYEGLGDRTRAANYIEALSGEMEEAASSARAVISRIDEELVRTGDFLDLVRSRQSLPDSLTRPPMRIPNLVIPTGTLEALIGTGDVDLIRDDVLRIEAVATLAVLRSAQSSYRDMQNRGGASFFEWLDINERIRFEDGPAEGRVRAGSIQRRPEAIAAFQKHHNTLLNTRRAAEGMETSIGRLRDAIAQSR